VGKKDFHPVAPISWATLSPCIALKGRLTDRKRGRAENRNQPNSIESQPEGKVAIRIMWSRADVIGLFSNNVVSFSRNVVLSGPSFSINVVWNERCCRFEAIMFSVRYT
jgi:hypothetical protein